MKNTVKSDSNAMKGDKNGSVEKPQNTAKYRKMDKIVNFSYPIYI